MASNRKGRSVSTEGLFFYVDFSLSKAWPHPNLKRPAITNFQCSNCDIDHNLYKKSSQSRDKTINNLVTLSLGRHKSFTLKGL